MPPRAERACSWPPTRPASRRRRSRTPRRNGAWLAEAAGGRHVVRLSYGRAGAPNPLDGLTDDEVTALAVADAAALFGVPLDERMLRASGRTAWNDALSHASLGQRDRVRELEDALAAEPTIEATGSWIAGTGLASVVPHALETARRIVAIGSSPTASTRRRRDGCARRGG